MENAKNLNPLYTRVRGAVNSKIEKLLKEQSNPRLNDKPNRSKKAFIKKVRKDTGVDSSYYLG